MLPDPADALGLLKQTVREAAPYALEAPRTARKLNQNEAPWDPPEDLKAEILARAGRLAWNRYPEFVPRRLTEAIAHRHDWQADGVLVGNGSNEVIQAALAVSVGQGDGVLVPAPSFSLYRLLVGVNGGRFLPVPLGPGFEYDVEALIAAARRERPRVIVLCSPNNPTGTALPEGAVDRLLGETDALLLCDEAYQDFGGPSAMPALRRSARVVVFRTFSKAMGFAGLRFGYALAHPAVACEIAKGKLPYNVNLVTLVAAEVALDHASRFSERVRSIVAERERFLAGLRGLAGLTVFPTEANFVLVRCDARPAGEVFRKLIEEHGILVRDVSAAPGLAECLRISIGTREDMDATLTALRALLPARAPLAGG